MKTIVCLSALLMVPTLVFGGVERPPCSGRLDVIKFKESSFEMVGDVVTEEEDSVTIIPENGGRVELRRELIGEILYDSREPRQITTKELVEGFTHCVFRVAGGEKSFSLVKVTAKEIYLSPGTLEGMQPGLELNVYREGEKIIDPETNQILGRERDFVGIIQVIGSEKGYAKAVPVAIPIEDFREGDTGMLLGESPTLAVAGITTLDGKESPYGALISEQIISKLLQNPDLKVVERRQLGQVLRELAIQNAVLSPEFPPELPSEVEKRQMKLETLDLKEAGPPVIIDEGMTRKMRMLEGADAIIVGTVDDVNGRGAVNLRVVDTSTAAVLLSTHQMVGNPEKPIIPDAVVKKEVFAKEQTPEGISASRTKDRSNAEKLDLLDRILRAIYQR